MNPIPLAEPEQALAAEPRAARLPGLSIVLPCHDEQDNVADAIRYASAAAEAVALEWEVIVVDDGSTDATAERATAFVDADERVRLVVHAVNRGYGDALRSGIAAARMPWVFLTDADLQFDLRELERFVPLAAHADVVVGRRAQRQDPFVRRANAGAWNWLVRRLFAMPVRDVDCAFKLIRADLLNGLALRSHGAMISTELVLKLAARGARLEERDVRHRPRVAGKQSGADPRVVVRAFRELAWLRGELRARPSTTP